MLECLLEPECTLNRNIFLLRANSVCHPVHLINPCLYNTILKLGRNDSGPKRPEAKTTHPQNWPKWLRPKRPGRNNPVQKRPGTDLSSPPKYHWYFCYPYVIQWINNYNCTKESSILYQSLRDWMTCFDNPDKTRWSCWFMWARCSAYQHLFSNSYLSLLNANDGD